MSAAARRNTNTVAFEMIAALLGAQSVWDSPADLLEQIAEIVSTTGLPHPGDVDALPFYRNLADRYGVDHDDADPYPFLP